MFLLSGSCSAAVIGEADYLGVKIVLTDSRCGRTKTKFIAYQDTFYSRMQGCWTVQGDFADIRIGKFHAKIRLKEFNFLS